MHKKFKHIRYNIIWHTQQLINQQHTSTLKFILELDQLNLLLDWDLDLIGFGVKTEVQVIIMI
ncbi:MAG: hypothetical protein CME98_24270 [Hyphomonas sp.]|nr:hypothetical protein [Hyphomonas sp.]